MVKGLNSRLRQFSTAYFRESFVSAVNSQTVNFLFFLFFLIFLVLFSLLNKRFFFFDLGFFNDNFVLLDKILALISTFFVIFLSNSYLKEESVLKSFEYFLIMSLSLVGMFFLISSNDFLSLYLSVEFQSLALYVLAAFKQNSLFSIEAGLKYFILGTFSSGLLLFGASLLYGFTGTLNFNGFNISI
jgi:NADH-quinone oxidoreductase subunit N